MQKATMDETLKITIPAHKPIKRSTLSHILKQSHPICPEVSLDLIRKFLKEMKREGLVDNTGKGRSSEWYKLGTNG